ncbi:MAG: hypothetical protein JWO71_707 [Candidatus Acidoferrum typicum]|nr:hypothetical protein [Candidatus Acidoferrum typicum]
MKQSWKQSSLPRCAFFCLVAMAGQAQIEGVPLSELEKRMMYFTANEEVPEDPIAWNEVGCEENSKTAPFERREGMRHPISSKPVCHPPWLNIFIKNQPTWVCPTASERFGHATVSSCIQLGG